MITISKTRPLNQKKYNIDKHRYLELYHYCLQYKAWKEELRRRDSTLKSAGLSEGPSGSRTGDGTSNLAIRRAELKTKCEIIEQTAKEADESLAEYIIKAVTIEGVTYETLESKMKIPCSRGTFYDRRRKFFWLLDKKI